MEYLIPPWQHQKTAESRAVNLPYFGYLFEPRTGKTGAFINTFRQKCGLEKRLLRTIIFCPPIVIAQWKDEFKKHSKINQDSIILLQGPGKKRAKDFLKYGFLDPTFMQGRLLGGTPAPAIFITNYETLLMPDVFDLMQKWVPEVLCFDESHYIKNPKAAISRQAERLAIRSVHGIVPGPKFKAILTGTPVLNTPMDLFQQFLVLDGGNTFGDNFYAFRGRFFTNRNAHLKREGGGFVPDKWELKDLARDLVDGAAELHRRLYRHAMLILKKDCFDLPPLINTWVKVGMTPEQRRIYTEVKKDFISYVRGNTLEGFEDEAPPEAVVAVNSVTKLLRLMQIASSYYATDKGNEISIDNTPKLAALKSQLEELAPHHKVLVWTAWRETYAQVKKVCESLNLKYVEAHGDISNVGKQKAVKDFKECEDIRVFIGHPGSGGIGIDLSSASYSIYYSLGYNLGHYLQSRERNHGGGAVQHEKITHIHLLCENSIDEIIREKLIAKKNISDSVLLEIATELEGIDNGRS